MAQINLTEQEIAVLADVLDTAWRKAKGRQTYYSGKSAALTSNHPEMEAATYKQEAEFLKMLRDKMGAVVKKNKDA